MLQGVEEYVLFMSAAAAHRPLRDWILTDGITVCRRIGRARVSGTGTLELMWRHNTLRDTILTNNVSIDRKITRAYKSVASKSSMRCHRDTRLQSTTSSSTFISSVLLWVDSTHFSDNFASGNVDLAIVFIHSVNCHKRSNPTNHP